MAQGLFNKPTPDPAGKTFGRYRVLSPLGQGAMASVFLAEDPALGRMVAIKVIHSHLAAQKDLLTRFTSEAKTAAALRSPNIVEVFDYGLEGASQYLVMEYIDGPTLQYVLNQQMGQPLESKLAASLMVQAAEGLMVAERKAVVHRDIKPENLMLNSGGLLKIADFGIAHINEQSLTQTGSVLGSPSYMAPEQVEGKKPSHQTDMFAMGAVFYACLTGRKPFNGANIPAIFRAIIELPHRPVLDNNPDADPQLAHWVDTLLSKKPEERGEGAKVVAGQLRQWLNKQGVYDPADYVHNHLNQARDPIDGTFVENPTKPVQPLGAPAPSPKPPASIVVPNTTPTVPPAAPRTHEIPISTSPSFSSLESPESTLDRALAAAPAPSPFKEDKGAATKSNPTQSNATKPNATKSQPSSASQTKAASSGPTKSGEMPPVPTSAWMETLERVTGGKGKLTIGVGAGLIVVLIGILIAILASGEDDATLATKPSDAAAVQDAQAMVPEVKEPAAPPPVLSLSPESVEMQVGSRRELRLLGLPDSIAPTRMVWSIQDSTLVRVDSGWIKALKAGQTTVEVGGEAAGVRLSAQSHVVVIPAPANAATPTTPTIASTPNVAKTDSVESSMTQLTVLSAPPFAEVFIDGLFIGATPTKNKSVKAGRHRVLISHRRFVSIDTQMTFKPGELKLKFHFTQTK
jgi:serine/threonine protein kinase